MDERRSARHSQRRDVYVSARPRPAAPAGLPRLPMSPVEVERRMREAVELGSEGFCPECKGPMVPGGEAVSYVRTKFGEPFAVNGYCPTCRASHLIGREVVGRF
ncbi:MAG TPA: hypothetical protein VHZ96_26445 [Frankiaceae bacterium]|nr:hypothetical protein [Frankiaceae bacterium]